MNGVVKRRLSLALAALAVLVCGGAYYALFRNPAFSHLPDPSLGSFPSLVHMLVLSWLSFALLGRQRGLAAAALLLTGSLIAETVVGTFTLLDSSMLIAGFAIGCCSAGSFLRKLPAVNFTAYPVLAGTGLMLFSSAMISGSYCGLGCGTSYNDDNAKPVYMDYATLRSSVRVSDARPLTEINRVYVYQSAVFLVSKNEGIHVLDNSDPSNPINAAFIEIPGNTEISIRDSFLYADSYIDLVTLDLSDPSNAQEVDRQTAIFPYNAYQNVPDNVYFGFDGIDEARGVVVSYEFIN